MYKGRKGLCFGISKGVSRPGNTSMKELLSDERFVEAVMEFLKIRG